MFILHQTMEDETNSKTHPTVHRSELQIPFYDGNRKINNMPKYQNPHLASFGVGFK